jgi:hypothetical protein
VPSAADADLWELLADLYERGEIKPRPLPHLDNLRCDDPKERARRLRAAAKALRLKLLLGRYAPAKPFSFETLKEAAD